jgi:hypothetical protein
MQGGDAQAGLLPSRAEVSGHLVGSAAFKAVGTGTPRPAGSIPVHLRHAAPFTDSLSINKI